jgi:hypothetical protein
VAGIANFVTFGIYRACYIEKALGKILLTILSVSLGVAQMKCNNKPGLGLCEKPFRTLPILASVLAQTVARIFAVRSLILLTSQLGYAKYAIFFAPHLLLVFVIKTLFETKSVRGKIKHLKGSKDDQWDKSVGHKFRSLLKFFASGISSMIVMIHLHDDRQQTPRSKPHFSFISHTLFFILSLIENLILVCLPYMVPELYPPLDCFTASSRANAVWIVAGLWLVGVAAQVLHYKWAHPWAKLNGPQLWEGAGGGGDDGGGDDGVLVAFTGRFCWKKDLQRVRLQSVKYSKIPVRLECKDLR